MGTGHHYGPAPWVNDLGRADWNPTYYHRADADGIGFDRGAKGSNAIAQYAPDVRKIFGDVKKTPENLLLWFHHVPWNHRMASGRTLWDELVAHYTRGVDGVAKMQATWDAQKAFVDAERFEQVKAYLAIQHAEAQWWRDACIAYFQSVNKLPLPAGFAPPKHPLEYYQSLKFPYAPGRT
jgi:alpha-glucuronidase